MRRGRRCLRGAGRPSCAATTISYRRGCSLPPWAARMAPRAGTGAHASITHALLGARACVYPGGRIGQEGFGFAHTKVGFLSVPHLGRVVLGDDVEVGANATINRGSTGDTLTGAGTRLDDLVQIEHSVRLGCCCVTFAHVGIAGATVLGDFVQVGGKAVIAGHLSIGNGVRIGAQAGLMSDVPAGAEVVGSPAQARRAFFRQVAVLRRMARQTGLRRPGEHRLPGGRQRTACPLRGAQSGAAVAFAVRMPVAGQCSDGTASKGPATRAKGADPIPFA